MKKLLIGLFAATAVVVSSAAALANGTPPPEPVAEGVEISGAVSVVGGWQHDDADAGQAGGIGALPDFGVARAANADHVRIVVDQVEVDLAKSFGENIRLRADIDFIDLANTGLRAADVLDLEQAYVTANLAAGNGIEFLIGKFNAPVGVEVVDTRDNWLISYAPPFRFMTPATVTGAKFYYAFSDLIDLHIAIVNDLNANGFGDSAMPSELFRLGFNWGEEGNESTLGISGGIGPEWDAATGNASNNAHFDFFGDLDAIIALSDTVTLAAEGVYRQSNTLGTGANQKAIAGFAALNYEASDVWDITARAGMHWEINPPGARGSSGASTTSGTWNGGGEDGMLLHGALGAGYMITDGAKLKLEGRYDTFMTSGPGRNDDAMSVLAQFAYTF